MAICAEHRSKCAAIMVTIMVTSLYEWTNLEWNEKPQTNKHSIYRTFWKIKFIVTHFWNRSNVSTPLCCTCKSQILSISFHYVLCETLDPSWILWQLDIFHILSFLVPDSHMNFKKYVLTTTNGWIKFLPFLFFF